MQDTNSEQHLLDELSIVGAKYYNLPIAQKAEVMELFKVVKDAYKACVLNELGALESALIELNRLGIE